MDNHEYGDKTEMPVTKLYEWAMEEYSKMSDKERIIFCKRCEIKQKEKTTKKTDIERSIESVLTIVQLAAWSGDLDLFESNHAKNARDKAMKKVILKIAKEYKGPNC
jgi:hypothetical protein